MTNSIAKNVLDFWFGDWPLTPEQNGVRSEVWFLANQDFDYDIERRFGKLVGTARQGSFDTWTKEPYECLALIIILDQFPRNLYRGQPGAFTSDVKALEFARAMLQSGDIDHLGFTERAFALMPYQHAENLAIQKEGFAAYQQQLDSAPKEWKKIMAGYSNFAKQHLDIIEQFGRFPHRNAALGRENTPEESDYLKDGGKTFGQ